MSGEWPQALELPAGRSDRGRLWFGLLGGAGAWLVHLMTSYTIAEFGCVSSFAGQKWYGISAVAWLCIAVSVISEIVALAAVVAAYRSAPEKSSLEGDAAYEPRRYTARLGLTLSSLFALAILFESVPIVYYLHHC